jgi:hypothetical protein
MCVWIDCDLQITSTPNSSAATTAASTTTTIPDTTTTSSAATNTTTTIPDTTLPGLQSATMIVAVLDHGFGAIANLTAARCSAS